MTAARFPRSPSSERSFAHGETNPRAREQSRARKVQSKPHANSRTKPLPRPHGNRLVFAPELIADGKRRYETTPESLDSIALDFGASRSTLRNVARRENWVRYVPPPRGLSRAAEIAAKAEALEMALSLPPRSGGEGRPPELAQQAQADGLGGLAESEAPATPNPSPPFAGRMGGGEEAAPAPGKAWSTRERIDALRNAVDEEIAAVRALRAKLKGVPHSTETAGRTSRTLADLTATLERLHRLEIGAPQHDGLDAYDDMPADIDAFRDALARRIAAFMESRPDQGDAAPDDAARADEARP